MAGRGKFIALEGIDGSGKRTQIDLLSRALQQRGIEHVKMSFPRYEGFFGRMVARYLNGEFGTLAQVDPHFSALLYAGDRLEHKQLLEEHLGQGKMILTDRYIGSNLAHQGARVTNRKMAQFLHWLEKLEYEVYGLPREDLVIYLRVPSVEARRLVGQKGARQYTRRRHDLHEASLRHLKNAAKVYDRLAKRRNWTVVECTERGHELLSPEMIHRRILDILDARILASLRDSEEF
ncbi:MAG TPA: dTMP kinase [Candidatus Acidoferrales bacterium]|nr:dTMP kinase [Candidatus Acidoferrales bacterium]